MNWVWGTCVPRPARSAAAPVHERGSQEECGGGGGGDGGDAAVEAMGFVGGAGGEEEGVQVLTEEAVAEGQAPEAVDGDDVAAGVGELAEESAGGGVKRVDGAVAEVADEEVAGEGAEVGGGHGHAPRGVEGAL